MEKFHLRTFLTLIRSLFPRWNFFDEIAHHFELEFKLSAGSAWTRLPFDQARTASSFWIHPAGNVAHAQMNLLEHFAVDVQGLVGADGLLASGDVRRLTTFRMLESMISARLRDLGVEDGPFQFKVEAVSPGGGTTVYVSDWCPLETA